MSLKNKIDFAVVFTVRNANPNGDPLDANSPRITYEGFGEVSDVCLKRKIRNRLQDFGESIFVQSDDRLTDEYHSLKERYDANERISRAIKEKHSKEDLGRIACDTWFDVRAFGQVFAFGKNNNEKGKGVSIGIRGPVTIQSAFSVNPISITGTQITKSTNSETKAGKDPDRKSSDTMGMKYRVDYGVYVFYGSINTQLASKTGFSDEDARKVFEALQTLFENDESSARPGGSMAISAIYWWKHNCPAGQYPAIKVHDSIKVIFDEGEKRLSVDYRPLQDLEVEIFPSEHWYE
jgi:CRISPR-associated protein Csd2